MSSGFDSLPIVSKDTAAKVLQLIAAKLSPSGVAVTFEPGAVQLLADQTSLIMREVAVNASARSGEIDAQAIHISFSKWAKLHKQLDFFTAMERAEEAACNT